ncbi:hypothetical protein JHK86_047872 [Glycine max]|nr:hypothetical protein JHK86_047872 [Glycine max]
MVMLKQADGSYACIAESANHFSLDEVKEELLRVLGLQEEEGSSLEFLRRGYKWFRETEMPRIAGYFIPLLKKWSVEYAGRFA